MKAIPRFDFPCIPANSAFTVRLMLSLTGEGVLSSTPLNISMVIDRSGSMEGEKIKKVKEAACMITGMLKPFDMFSLVAFNDTVETIVPLAKGADLAGVEELINKINAGGSTNLSGGYDQGFCLVSEGANAATSRVVLLSDGQANVGILSPEHLAQQAHKYLAMNVTTTTFGVGHDFDETLMTVLAEQGGGSANYIEHPWQAAEVFREELEDLRSIAATHATVKFNPASPVSSCVQLNNFYETGNNRWLVGDVYGSKERRLILELVIKPGSQTGEINVGSFEFTYSMPGGHKPVELQIPVSINVVPEQEFKSVTPDREIGIEAALLAVARAKDEALRLASNGQYIEAANLLDNYVTALTRLCLKDPELDLELERLKERAWNLRNRGEQYFTAAERKSFVYESDLAMKGQKDKYLAMQRRNSLFDCAPSGAGVSVISRLQGQSMQFTVDNPPNRLVSDFLAEVFRKFQGAVETGSYGRSWLLRDKATQRTFDIGTSWARAQRKQKDNRKLEEVGLTGALCLEVIQLFPLHPYRKLGLSASRICLELLDGMAIELEYRESALACDFLAVVYDSINRDVPPNSYGRQWVLRDKGTGRVFDFGSAWARAHKVQTDTRPIGKVGVMGGSVLEVVKLQ